MEVFFLNGYVIVTVVPTLLHVFKANAGHLAALDDIRLLVDLFIHVEAAAVVRDDDLDLVILPLCLNGDVKGLFLLHSMDDAVLYDRLEQKFHDEAVVCAGLDLLVQLDKFPVPDLLDHDVVLNTADAAEF